MVPALIVILFVLPLAKENFGFKIDGELAVVIVFIYGWTLSVSMWIKNLFEEQEKEEQGSTRPTQSSEEDIEDLLGGWYIEGSVSFVPVLAFEGDHKVTFSDGKTVKEYKYHICCDTCIILTAEDGDKVFINRSWIKNKPHLIYKDQEFIR